MQRKRMPDYLKRAKKRFLQGLWYASPVEAVLAGKRTLEEWVEVVTLERDFEMRGKTTRKQYPEITRAFQTEAKT
jgi:hypothetical protein